MAASSEVNLTAELGRETGSAAARRLRHEEKIPGVVYGQGADAQTVTVVRRDLRIALSGPAGNNALITLKVGGDPQLTIVRDLQRDPIKRVVTHVDFLRINRDEEIEVEVPIHLEGEATDVLRNDGLVDLALDHLTVIAKPRRHPAVVHDRRVRDGHRRRHPRARPRAARPASPRRSIPRRRSSPPKRRAPRSRKRPRAKRARPPRARVVEAAGAESAESAGSDEG